ncbi:hypothetical protein CAAN1_06S03422 [[Candida] anglica]|uniref:Uncharacterized protein n=1 Tax=[Candida] anglica TaxID=148631 RepID=A0ABP0ELB7_9ASCO
MQVIVVTWMFRSYYALINISSIIYSRCFSFVVNDCFTVKLLANLILSKYLVFYSHSSNTSILQPRTSSNL